MASIKREKDYHLTLTVGEYNLMMTALLTAQLDARENARISVTPYARQKFQTSAERYLNLRGSLA